MSDPEETQPFVSPSGPRPPTPPPPPPPPPSLPPPVPYGVPQPWAPVYGAPYPGTQDHKGATTALVLGIVSVVCLLGALFCCVTLPGALCAPFAWAVGAKAKREIERAPGVYGNLGAAQTGMWMGIVVTILGALVVAGFVALAVFIGVADPSLV